MKSFHIHRENAQLLAAMFNHKEAITIHAGSLKYDIMPGSVYYDQVKHLISIAKKHLVIQQIAGQ